jgi:hypothetical protein
MTDTRESPGAGKRGHDQAFPDPIMEEGGIARILKTTAPGAVIPQDVDLRWRVERGGAPQFSGFLKTTVPDPVAPQDVGVRKRKPGGQPGNRNAWKRGMHNKRMREIKRGIADMNRRKRALLARVEQMLAERQEGKVRK